MIRFLTITCIVSLVLVTGASHAQTGKTYHVTSTTLNVRKGPSVEHKVIHTFKQYDNVTPLETTDNGWVKLNVNGEIGYVSGKYIKPGKAIVSVANSYRIGARCRDGSRSSATGRGACSHHGGVDHWLYKEDTTVRIVDE